MWGMYEYYTRKSVEKKMIIGTGIDIVEVNRVEEAFKKWGRRFLGKIFTDREIRYAKGKNALFQHLAARFAAKEAVFKAMGDDKLSWKDIEILNGRDGKPKCRINPRFIRTRAKTKIEPEILLSISHAKEYAVASVVLINR
jgi:holo-[acyl-carrier protein] synthase